MTDETTATSDDGEPRGGPVVALGICAVVCLVLGLIVPGMITFAAVYGLLRWKPGARRWLALTVALFVGQSVSMVVALALGSHSLINTAINLAILLPLTAWLWFSDGGRLPAALLLIVEVAVLIGSVFALLANLMSLFAFRAALAAIVLHGSTVLALVLLLREHLPRRQTPGEVGEVFD